MVTFQFNINYILLNLTLISGTIAINILELSKTWPDVSIWKIIYKRNFDDHRKKIFESTTLKNMYNYVDLTVN